MSNERIDLTQFEGHTEGPWYYEMPPEEGMVIKVSDFCHVAELSFLMSNMSPYTDDVNPTGLDPDAVDARLILAAPDLLAELKKCYEREDMIIRALKDAWIGNTCWHQPSEHLEDIAETRGSTLGHIASLLQVDVNRQDIHDLEYGCGGENCERNASE